MPEICLRWMDNFEVGIDDLDADHRHMYLQINTICEATAAGDMDVVARQLSAFVEFAAAHIERETRVLTALDPGRVFAGTALDRLKPISTSPGDSPAANRMSPKSRPNWWTGSAGRRSITTLPSERASIDVRRRHAFGCPFAMYRL